MAINRQRLHPAVKQTCYRVEFGPRPRAGIRSGTWANCATGPAPHIFQGEQRLASTVERSELSRFNSSSRSAAKVAVMKIRAGADVSSAVEAAAPPGRDIGIASPRWMMIGNDRLRRPCVLTS